eukprot:scaffold30832_cov67-Phaeocystis_antarctica.AAC.13
MGVATQDLCHLSIKQKKKKRGKLKARVRILRFYSQSTGVCSVVVDLPTAQGCCSRACCSCSPPSTAGGRESGLMTTDMQATPTRELAQATLVGGRDPSLPSARGRAT